MFSWLQFEKDRNNSIFIPNKSWFHLKRFTTHQLICIVVFFLFSLKSSGQTAKIDSLTNLISEVKGEELCQVYLDLAKEYNYVDPNKVIYYADLALPIAVENGNKEQEAVITSYSIHYTKLYETPDIIIVL